MKKVSQFVSNITSMWGWGGGGLGSFGKSEGDSEKANSEKEGIIDSNEGAYSIHHEESKSFLFC
jgi:hypothetical protein